MPRLLLIKPWPEVVVLVLERVPLSRVTEVVAPAGPRAALDGIESMPPPETLTPPVKRLPVLLTTHVPVPVFARLVAPVLSLMSTAMVFAPVLEPVRVSVRAVVLTYEIAVVAVKLRAELFELDASIVAVVPSVK